VKVCLVHLESLLEELDSGEEAFVGRNPGAFLVAAGLAERDSAAQPPAGGDEAAALVIEPTKGRRDVTRKRLDFTTVVRVAKPRPGLGQPHPLLGTAFHLEPDEEQPHVVVGRSASCDITVPDRSVSEEHCRILVTARGVVVVDMGSTNGTTVNGTRLEPYRAEVLADEDLLGVGSYVFQLLSSPSLFAGLMEARQAMEG
jgi:hypothetical protein